MKKRFENSLKTQNIKNLKKAKHSKNSLTTQNTEI